MLRNPDYEVESRYLAHPESAASQAIESPWSEPTGADCRAARYPHPSPSDHLVMFPGEPDHKVTSIFYATNTEGISRQAEPEGKVMVMQWMKDSGITAHDEFPNILRGQNLDFHYTIHPHVPPGTPDPQPIRVNYTTGDFVVDLAGGDGFAGEILMLVQSGKLVAHNNIDDDEVFQTGGEGKSHGDAEARAHSRAPRRTSTMLPRRQTARQTSQAAVSRFSVGGCR